MLRVVPMSLTGAASRWLRNEPSRSIINWETMKTKFLNKYCPPAHTAKQIEEINNFQQEPDESLFQAWERFKELLMKYPQHYLTDMQEVILFYNGLDVPTRQILDFKEVGNNEGLMDEYISSDDDKDQTNSYMIIKPEIKIGDEFLKILLDNSFNGTDGSDVTDHIARVLEITEWIKIPNMYKDKLRLHVFSKSLIGDAKKWWNDEGTTTTWKELYDKFLDKYYPLSHTYKNKNVKSGLWEFYVNGRTKGTIDDLVNYNEPCEESNEKTCSDLFFKPYLDAQDGKDIYEIIDRDYSSIPIPAHHNISNPDELCQTEEFTVVRNNTAYRYKEIDDMVYSEKDVC
ncbi:reverse transcriptase domain-containing protein [Tanacetum coccineum]|uniref:Reverse transcriptase domain-containing protein n=1 Tax=Tanacetum coccineum TaxID=301880 RepID=A0ABQ5IED7_9ASTR